MLCLLFDLHASDEELVKWLLLQETECSRLEARGIRRSLDLACYLVASFQKVDNTGLLWRARLGNSDTSLGIDYWYLFAAGVDPVLDFIDRTDEFPERDQLRMILEAIGIPAQAAVDSWWAALRKSRGVALNDLPAHDRMEIAFELGEMEEARRQLDRWEESLDLSDQRTLSALAQDQGRLRQFDQAVSAYQRIIDLKADKERDDPSTAARYGMAAVYATRAHRLEEALEFLQRMTQVTENWFYSAEQAFALCLAAPATSPVKRAAYDLGRRMLDRYSSVSREPMAGTLRRAQEAAATMGDAANEQIYRERADA